MKAFDDRLVRWAVATGLGPLFLRAAAHHPQALTPPLWDLLQGANLTARALSTQQIDAMTEIIEACRGRVGPLVLLKGISISEQHYPEPHLRPMRDIDFLSEDDAVPVVDSVLSQLGYRQQSEKPPLFYDGHHHTTPFLHPETGVWAEVHRALFPSHSEFGSDEVFNIENLRQQLRPSEFGGRPVRRLSNELQLVYLACHWARRPQVLGGVVPLVDVIYLLKNTELFRWRHVLAWMEDSPMASRHLYLLLSYLEKHRLIDIDPEILHRLCLKSTFLDHLSLQIAHGLIDRYLIDGRNFGPFLTFRRLWKILVLRRSRFQCLQPASRTPSARSQSQPGGLSRATDGSAISHAHPGFPSERLEQDMKPLVEVRPPRVPALTPVLAEHRDSVACPANQHPKRRSDVLIRVVDGQMVILDRRRQLIHHLNETARYIWYRCDGQHTISEIAEELAQAFDVERAAAAKDVAAAVGYLARQSLLAVAASSENKPGGRDEAQG
jgi:hypothetical protein